MKWTVEQLLRTVRSAGGIGGEYVSLVQAMFDNAVSRVYLGVHWRFDGLDESIKVPADILNDTSNVGGVPMGRAIAQDIFGNGMSKSSVPRSDVVPVILNPVP